MAAWRVRTLNLSQMLAMWKLAVRSLIPRMRPISQLVLPCAAQYRQSCSRAVSVLNMADPFSGSMCTPMKANVSKCIIASRQARWESGKH